MWNGLNLSWPWNPIPLVGLILLCLLYGFGISRAQKSGRQDTPLKKGRIVQMLADQAMGGALLLLPGLIDLVVMTPLFFLWLAPVLLPYPFQLRSNCSAALKRRS